MASNVECPACSHSWPATEADLGLQKCPACGIVLEVKRMAIAWSYEAEVVTAEGKRALALKRLRRGGRGDPPRRL